MRFLSIYKAVETNTPPTLEHIANMERLIEESTKAGTLIATEGCLPSALGARVRRSGGKLTVTDGPFTESKEWIAGFDILECENLDEAIAIAARHPQANGGKLELRPFWTRHE